MKKLIKAYDEIEEKILAFSLLISLAIVFIQVIMRKVFNSSLSWSEELARYIFIWQCWLGVSLAFKTDSHIFISMLSDKIGGRGRDLLESFGLLLTLIFCIFLVYQGFNLVLTMANRGTLSSGMRVPLKFIYACVPVSCLITSIRLVGKIVEKIANSAS